MNYKKKLVLLTLFITTLLISWIYRIINTRKHDATILYKKSSYFMNSATFIDPLNSTCEDSTFLIIIVTSYVGHIELRSAHRRAMSQDLLKSFNVSRIFLLSKIPNGENYITQEAIKDESNTFGDILQGSFVEHYRNLTLKHFMGLQWVATVCNKAKFVLKIDDDTVFNLNQTYELLKKQKELAETTFLMGYMLNNTKPRRNRQNKWYVTEEEYGRNVYPPYLSGWYYITNPKTAFMICEEAVLHSFFWIDDIFITGLLTEILEIPLIQLPNGYWLEYYELLECCLRDMINKYIKCSHTVGPNGGRNNLIVEFNDALRNCDMWKNCTTRPIEQTLNKVCVAYKERTIFSDGQAEVQYVKL